MANTRQIRQRIKTTGNIAKITKAMEMVSASKMRRAQVQALATRPYTRALQHSLATVAAVLDDKTLHPLFSINETGQDVLLLISTDKGLCGSLNPTLFKAASNWSIEHPTITSIVVGKKAVAYAQMTGMPIDAQFVDLPEQITVGDILPIATLIMDRFLNQTYKSVSIVYMDFISTLVQKVRLQPLLPIAAEEAFDETLLKQVTGAKYLFEPSAKEILEELLPYFIENAIFQAFLEARASEHSARMVSMKNASENAKDLMGEIKLEYNKSRQAAVTNELLDITTAKMAQS